MDVRPLRESRDFRLLTAGALITGLGTQATLVALPYQVFLLTNSAFLTGLVGAAELIPLIVASHFGGALADRFDRRIRLLVYQLALVVLAAALAGASAVERVVRAAIVPNVVRPERLRVAISVIWPLPGDAGGRAGPGRPADRRLRHRHPLRARRHQLPLQPALEGVQHEPVLRSIRTGLAYVRRLKAVPGGFVIDLSAMTFGMPRALFPVLSLTAFHTGAAGTGLLYGPVRPRRRRRQR